MYRRRQNSDTWHWMPKCSWWPVFPMSRYEEQAKKPTTGELCNQCISKAKHADVKDGSR